MAFDKYKYKEGVLTSATSLHVDVQVGGKGITVGMLKAYLADVADDVEICNVNSGPNLGDNYPWLVGIWSEGEYLLTSFDDKDETEFVLEVRAEIE